MRIGSITIIDGCMYSKKTSTLINELSRLENEGFKVMAINNARDNRYTDDNLICSHDLRTLKCIKTYRLMDLDIDQSIDVIGIDEGQFFPDIVKFSEYQANQGKIVYVAMLNGTFERKPFDTVVELYSLADNVIRLKATCSSQDCHNDAIFSWKKESRHVIIDTRLDMYQPLCRLCYHSMN